MRRATVVSAFILLLTLLGCAGRTALSTPQSELSGTPTALAAAAGSPTLCNLAPIVVPTMPAEIPGYTELDEATGLHMTGTPQQIDVTSWRLEITGTVRTPLSLSYDDLRCMPRMEHRVLLICPGFFEDEATWAGVSLDYLLQLAGLPETWNGIMLYGADDYTAYVPRTALGNGASFLAYEWEGQPVPILHGFPMRAVFPSQQGNKWVKWLLKIEVQ